jgi:hypothetical protein
MLQRLLPAVHREEDKVTTTTPSLMTTSTTLQEVTGVIASSKQMQVTQ